MSATGGDHRTCVVFDFDGTLVDSNAAKRDAFVRIFEAIEVPGETVEAVLADSAGVDRYGVIARTVRRAQDAGLLRVIDTDIVSGLAEAYNAICEEYTATCAEVSGVAAVLPRLAGRHPLYVVSDTPEEPLRRVVERRGWRAYFRDVLGRPRTKVENLALIMRREAVEPERIVVVGDSCRDLSSARYYGCRFIGIRSDGNDFDEPGLLVLDDVFGLEAVIAAIHRRGIRSC